MSKRFNAPGKGDVLEATEFGRHEVAKNRRAMRRERKLTENTVRRAALAVTR